jgi:hypothetical protein
MIVLDEGIYDPDLAEDIAAWYKGRVTSIKQLRPRTIIKDDAMVMLVRAMPQPTFVTTNVIDFWRVIPASAYYAIVNIDLSNEQLRQLPTWLRACLRMPIFKSKASRMGKVIRLRPTRIEYYEADWHIKTLAWPH